MLLVQSGSSALQLIQVLLIFVFVLAVTYFTTKFIAGHQKGIQRNKSIQILDMAKVANNKYIQIVKVTNKYLILGISKDNITMLAELSEEEAGEIRLSDEGSGKQFSESLNEILEKVKERLPKKQAGNNELLKKVKERLPK